MIAFDFKKYDTKNIHRRRSRFLNYCCLYCQIGEHTAIDAIFRCHIIYPKFITSIFHVF